MLGASGRVVIAGLANAYADYTVTFEEYQEQRYEGGSTIFGPHQLDGYIEQLLLLADALANGTAPASDPPPEDFTHRILDTSPGKQRTRDVTGRPERSTPRPAPPPPPRAPARLASASRNALVTTSDDE